MKPPPYSREEIDAMVAESRAKQGLPPKVTDPAALARVAELFVQADRDAAARRKAAQAATT